MKHNEIKSYFRKRLQKELNDIGIKCLNVDETNNFSRIYLVKDEVMETKFLVSVFFNTDGYSINIYPPKKVILTFKDSVKEAQDSYTNLTPMYELIKFLKENC